MGYIFESGAEVHGGGGGGSLGFARAHLSSDASGGSTVPFDVTTVDTEDAFDTSTGEYIVPADGIYHVDFTAAVSDIEDGESVVADIYVNGSSAQQFRQPVYDAFGFGVNLYDGPSSTFQLVKDDIIEGYVTGGGDDHILQSGSQRTSIAITHL